jgi:hypothetical protein
MRGCGRIQRAILKLIDDGVADLYAPEDLAKSIYHRPATSERRRVIVNAAQSLARKYPEKIALAEYKGRDLLWVIRRPAP